MAHKQRTSINLSCVSDAKNWKAMYLQEHEQRLESQRQNKILKIKYQRMVQRKYGRQFVCQKCDQLKPQVPPETLKKQGLAFSKLIQGRLENQKITSTQELVTCQFKEPFEEEVADKTHVPFIQNFAVFGIPDDDIINCKAGDYQSLEGEVVLSIRKCGSVEQHAVSLAVPSGMTVKRVTGDDRILSKVVQLMTKIHSNQNTFLLTFQPQPNRFDSLSKEAKKLLDMLNPSRKLFCLCVGTYDFTYIGKLDEQSDAFSTQSLQLSQEFNQSKFNSSGFLPNLSQVAHGIGGSEIGISQRVYCLMSYYPFFSFFFDILLAILKNIKAQRLEIYNHKIQHIKQIDSKFQLRRLRMIYNHSLRKFNKQLVKLNMSYHLNLMNQTALLKTDASTIMYSESEAWSFEVLSLFTIDTFIDVLTLFMLEDKLFFVCDQSRILTYTVYMVSNLLPRPFKSAFSSVCIIPKEEEFLNAPFPCGYGLLKKRKWLQDNQILMRFKNTYVFISPTGVSIQYTENRKDLLKKRPQKLKGDLGVYFKEMERRKKIRRKTFRYDHEQTEYNWNSDREDRDIIIRILETVKSYLTSQVLNYLPDIKGLKQIKARVDKQPIPQRKDPHTYLIQQLISHVIERRKSKDPFVDCFLRTQMMSVYLSDLVDLAEESK